MPIFILCSCGACLRLHTIAFLSSRLFSFKFSFASSVGASAKITISSRFFFLHIVLSYQGDKHLLSFSTLLPLTQPTAFFLFSSCLLCFSALSFAHIYLYIYISLYIYYYQKCCVALRSFCFCSVANCDSLRTTSYVLDRLLLFYVL